MTNHYQPESAVDHHNELARAYDSKHQEIFNDIEQARIEKIIEDLVKTCYSGHAEIQVLDFGAGTGNLTRFFLQNKCRVSACDVSMVSLDILRQKLGCDRVSTTLLTGDNLPFADGQFDITATYSVLHHIPDYLHAVRELVRVLKPGGLIYIDHEFNNNHWKPDPVLAEYYAATSYSFLDHVSQLIRHGDFFSWSLYKTALTKLFVNRRYEREGDIHVWPDDYVVWDKILEIVCGQCVLVRDEDYLFYRPKGGVALYERFRARCSDMKFVVARKQPV